MTTWRIGNFTSDDFARQQSGNDSNANYGATWKFANDRVETSKKIAEQIKNEKEKEQEFKELEKTASLTPEQIAEMAKKEDEKAMDQYAEFERAQKNPAEYRKELEKLSKEELADKAAEIGVVDLNVGKNKLIQAIIEKLS